MNPARAWLCEFARADGLAGFVRLELREAIASYWAYLVGVPDVDGVLLVRDDEVPLPRPWARAARQSGDQRLEIRTEGLWAELLCETAGEHWTLGLEAFGLRLDAVAEAWPPGDEIGERVAVGLDLEWEVGADGPPEGVVRGDVLVGRARHEIEAPGAFHDGDAPPGAAFLEAWLRMQAD